MFTGWHGPGYSLARATQYRFIHLNSMGTCLKKGGFLQSGFPGGAMEFTCEKCGHTDDHMAFAYVCRAG